MTEQVYSSPDIYKIYVPLPDNPLKNLNCYVVKTADENLIIDTGFNRPECLAALKEGLSELEIDINKTKLFLTHLHSDHTGLTGEIMEEGSQIYMSKIDFDRLEKSLTGKFWPVMEELFRKNAFPEEDIALSAKINPARAFAPSKRFKAICMNDGDKITVGGLTFTGILTPGHTPGHMCLYLEEKKILFTGDHVLFDITPNITSWNEVEDSLGDYIESLKKIRGFEVETALPGHRLSSKNFYVRIDELLEHHRQRLDECYNIICQNPDSTAYFIASKMKWSMRGKNWSEFPVQQKWFAVGETLSHLDYLIKREKIEKNDNGKFSLYRAK